MSAEYDAMLAAAQIANTPAAAVSGMLTALATQFDAVAATQGDVEAFAAEIVAGNADLTAACTVRGSHQAEPFK